MAAGKLRPLWSGRFTALTVCGVMHHSVRSTGFFWSAIRRW